MEVAIEEAAALPGFGPEQILAVHHRLLERTNPRIAGRFRTVQNWIGGNGYTPCGADFVPPPCEYLKDLIADLCAAVDDDLLPPLVQAALVHAQFETIHPFDDGNGRTGRALIHVVLRRRGVAPAYVPPISVVLANSRGRYIRGLTRYREDGIEEWVEQFAAAAANLYQGLVPPELVRAVRVEALVWSDPSIRTNSSGRVLPCEEIDRVAIAQTLYSSTAIDRSSCRMNPRRSRYCTCAVRLNQRCATMLLAASEFPSTVTGCLRGSN